MERPLLEQQEEKKLFNKRGRKSQVYFLFAIETFIVMAWLGLILGRLMEMDLFHKTCKEFMM